ncbi:MAG: hypothetical protein NVSMB70_09740 [Chamaesiphon sp.]
MFDNALVVHSRAGLIDAPLLFLESISIWMFLNIQKYSAKVNEGEASPFPFKLALYSIILGVALGSAFCTKLNALFLIGLPIALVFVTRGTNRKIFIGSTIAACLITYLSIWYVHFALAINWNEAYPAKTGYFLLPLEHQQWVKGHTLLQPWHFLQLIVDAINYSIHYHSGIAPAWDCAKNNNSGPVLYWLIGARAINFRSDTVDATHVKWIIEQCNPIIWGISLVSLFIISAGYIFKLFYQVKIEIFDNFSFRTFYFMYLFYMVMMLRIHRAMYLYHYFPALLLTFFMVAMLYQSVPNFGRYTLTIEKKEKIMLFTVGLIVAIFYYYSPITYHLTLSKYQLAHKEWIHAWNFIHY